MSTRLQWLLVGAVVALLAGGGWVLSRTVGDELTQVTVGSRAPDFSGALVVRAPLADLPAATDATTAAATAAATGAGTAAGTAAPAAVAAGAMPAAVDGASRSMADYRGQVMLLNIWATWCAPCRVEMPSIQALHEALGPRGLKVVAVSVDQPGKASDIRAFADEMGLTFDIVHDSLGAIEGAYRTTGVPMTFVVARDGTIRKKWLGPEDWNAAANRRLISALLAEPAP